ncbi:hypothetical protein U9M48_015066 [Paspalum notatum var. saurae]|uniref:glutathione transferase n=1 Tax=Paspalum notatum var. saurae TaxID=547442 RepID=A0AAQ3T3X4_PASNO
MSTGDDSDNDNWNNGLHNSNQYLCKIAAKAKPQSNEYTSLKFLRLCTLPGFQIKLVVDDDTAHIDFLEIFIVTHVHAIMEGLRFGGPIVQVYHEKSMILPDVSRVLACLYEKDIKFETHTASYKSLLRLQASSHAPVPFYDGTTFLEESREICRYIAEMYEHHGTPFLLGKDALERASVEQWLHHEEHAFNPPSRALFCHLAFPLDEEDDGDDIDMHTRKLEEVLDVYEQRLGDSEFLVGDKFTLADLVHLPNSHYIKTSNKFVCLYDSRKNVRRWWDAISDRDSWKKVLNYMESVKNQNRQEELDRQQQHKEDPRASSHPIQNQVYSRKQVSTEPQTILVSPADSYKSDSRAAGVDSQFKEAVTYSAHTPPELETTGTSASKLQTTDVHRRLQDEQWHDGTTGLNDIKQHADRLMSTGQGKLSNDVQQYQLQDSEQATSHPVPQEPMGMELVQGREKIARRPYTFFLNCRPYTDQSRDVLSPLPQQNADAREIVEDNALSGKRGIVPSSSTQEHGVAPPRQAADKDGQSMIPSQAEYPGGQDTRKQHRDHGSVSTQRAVQDARATFDESKASNFTISNERFSYASQSSPRQDLDGARHTTTPSEQRYPGFEDTSKQAEDKISTPRQMADQDAEDTTEETKISESSSSRVQHSYVQRPDAPSRKQEKIEDPHSATSAIQRKYANVKDISGLSRDTAFKPMQTIGQDDQETFREPKSGDASFLRDQQSGTWQTVSSSTEQEVDQTTPSQTRYQSSTLPSKTSYPIAKDDSKQPRGTASTPKKKAAQDDVDTSEESNTAEEVTSTEKPSNAWIEPVSPQRQELEESSRANTSFQKRDPHDEDTQVADTASASWQIAPDGGIEETKLVDSTPLSSKHMYTQKYSLPPRQAKVEDANDKSRHSRVTIAEPQKMVSRDAQATHEDAHGATGGTIQSPDILETSKKSRGTYEEAKGPGSMLSKAQSLGAQYAQGNTGESTTPTAGQRKEISAKPQPDVKDGLEESKLSAADWNGLDSLSSEGRDGLETETTITEEKTLSTGQLREPHKKSESTTPKAHPTDLQGTVEEEKAPSIYQKKPLVAKDSQERAQTIRSGENADGSTPKHQQDSYALNTSDEKLNASEQPRAKSHGGFSEDLYREDTTDGQKVAPPLLSRELTSQVQPPSEPSHDAAFHGDLSSQSSTIDQWRRASVPLHDVTPSSVDDEMAISTVDQNLTPMSQQESGEQIMEPPIPLGAEASGVQPASPSFPGASVDDHATINDKFSKQPIIDDRAGEPIQMRTSSSDALPSSEPTKRAILKGHQISDLEHVSTPDRQISEAKKARDDPAIVHEDAYDVNLSTHDMGKDTLKKTKVPDSTPSSAKPMYIQQAALTPSRQTQVEEAMNKTIQSRETIPERQKMVERKPGMSGEQSPDHQKASRPSRQLAAEDAPTGDRIQSPDILDTSKKSRGTFEESIGPGSTLPKAQVLSAQDSELTKGKSTVPTAEQRKDWKDAKDDVPEEKSFSTERLKDMFQERESTTPKTQPTDSQESSMEKTTSIYQKRPLPAQDSREETQIPAGDKVDSSTPEHQESSGAPYTYDEKIGASAPARADIHDYHSAEKPYKKYTADDQKVDPSISGKEPASQVQPSSEPLRRAVPDGDLPSKSFTVDQWQHVSAPLHGVITDSGDADVAMSSNIDQKSRPKSQEANLSSQRVSQMAKQSGEQRIKPFVPIGEETSDVGQAATSLPVGAKADDAIINDKFTKQSNVDERVGEPKQMQAPNTAAHPVSAPTKRILDGHEVSGIVSSPEGPTLEAVKATQDPATIPENVHDASVLANDTYEKEARYASGDELLRGSLHDQQAQPPASGQAHPTVDTPHDSADLGKTELAKPTVIDQEATTPIAYPTSTDPHRAGILPAEVAHSEQKSVPSGSTRAAQSIFPVEPIKADSNVSAANYTSQMSFRQQARPSPPSTIGIPASDTQGVIGKIQEVTPDDRPTDDSGKQFVPSQEQASHSSQVIPGKEEMVYPPSTRVVPTSDTQLASAEVHEVTPDDQHALQSSTPLVSSEKQGSYVGSAFESGELDPAEKKLASSDQELHHSAEQHGEPRKEQTVVPTSEQIKAQPTIIGRQETEDNRKEALTSEDVFDTTPTHGDHPTGSMEPARKPLSVEGGEPTSATQAPSPHVVQDSSHTEDISADLENVRSMKPSTTPDAHDITGSSTVGEVVFTEQQSAPPGQGSSEPRSKEIGDLSPSTQLNYTTEPRNGDAIVAAPGQAKDSQGTPWGQFKLSAPSFYTQLPSREPQEDEPADDLGEVRSSKPSSVEEDRSVAAVPVSAPDTQHGAAPDEVTVDEQKFAPSGQGSAHATFTAAVPDTQSGIELDKEDVGKQKVAPSGQHSVHSVQPSFSTEPTKENTVADAADQTSTLEKVIDQNYMTPALDKVKTPFSGTPYASRKTQKGTDDDHIDEKLPSQWRVSPDRHVSESPKGLRPEAHSDVDKKATPGSSQAETSNTVPDSTPIYGDARLSSSDVPAESSLPETQDLQGSASAQNGPADPLGNIESPTYLSTDQVMEPKMSPTIPSVSPLGTVPGTNSVQAPQQASTVDLESGPDTQHGMPQGRANPDEQKFTISDQKPAHISEPKKEEGNAAAGDRPNVSQGPETTDQHQVKAPSPDAREPLQKDNQPSHDVLPSDLHDGPTSEVHSAVVDKETPLMLSRDQTSAAERNSTLTSSDVPPTSSLEKREAEPPAATQAPTSQVLQSSALAQNESPRQASADQVMVPAINSAAPSDAPQLTEPGRNSSLLLQPPFSTKTTKEDTAVTADDQAKDMKTITHQQAITPAPGTAKTPFPSTQDASRIIQDSIDDGRIDELLPSQEQVSLLGSNSELREGQTADPHGTHVDEKTTKSPSSQANISDSKSGLARALGDVVPSTGEGLAKISSPEHGEPTQLPAATQDVSLDASSKAKPTGQGDKALTGDPASVLDTQPGSSQTQGEAAPAEQNFAVTDKEYANASKSVPSAESRKEKTNAANVDQMSVPHTTVTHQVTSSTPDASEALSRDNESSRNDDAIRNLVDPLIASQEEDTTVAAADQAEGMQTIAHQQAISPAPGASKTPVPSIQDASRTIQESTANDGHVDEPLPSQEQVSLQGSYSEPREEQTTDPYGMNIDEKTATFPSSQENISDLGSGLAPTLDVVLPSADEGPAKISFPEPREQKRMPAATQDVSLEASSKAKSTGQGAKALTGDPASVLDTQPGSSQTQGEAAPAEQNFAVTDKKSANGSKSPFSAEPREEQTNVATADQTSVPETTTTNQAANAKPDASDTLEKDHESSRDDDHIRNSVNLVVSEEAASGRASEESSDAIDKKMTLPSSETQTSNTELYPTPNSSDAYLSGAGVPATSSVRNQDLQPPATQALTTQALQGSPSFQIVPDSLEKLNSPRLPSTMAPVTSPATPSGAPQGTEPGTHSWPKGRMESSEKSGNQQQTDKAIVEPLEGNEKQAEQIKRHDSETIEPEDMEASENTNQRDNRRSPVETLGHSGKHASGVQQLGENTKGVPDLTENAPGDVQAVSKSEDSSRSSEESKVLQSEDKNQGGETESPISDGHPSGRGLAANSYQNNSSQSQAAAPDKSVEQSSPDIQNKGKQEQSSTE